MREFWRRYEYRIVGVLLIVFLMALIVLATKAEAHKNKHKEVVQVQGTA